MRISLASSLFAVVAVNSQAAPAASMRLGQQPPADVRALPEPQPSGGRPMSPQSKAVAVRLGSLEGTKASFGRELEEFTCSGGVEFVECNNGNQVVDGVRSDTTTCATACGTDCCQGTLACDKFTGRVCRDGSCYGEKACFQAKIGLVDDSCKGPQTGGQTGACFDFGLESTTTSSIRLKNSCTGVAPCWRAVRFTGRINGDIIDSCHGKWSCYGIAQDGEIDGDIIRSCRAPSESKSASACDLLAGGGSGDRTFDPDAGGFKGGIIDSCWGNRACHHTAKEGKIVGILLGSCQAPFQCNGLARIATSEISHIHGCCNTAYVEHHDYSNFHCCHGGSYTPADVMATAMSAEDGCYTDWEADEVHGDSDIPDACTAPIPTPPPTSSPTPSNIWTLEVQDTAATLAGGDDGDIKFTYLIAAGRDYEMSLLQKGCATGYEVDGALYNVTNITEVVNSTHQWLNVTYSLDKAALASSRIWNNITSTIELCQVTSLYEIPNEQIGKIVVATSATELEVFVSSIANFTIATNLTSEKIFNETEEVDAAAAIKAFKCDDKFNQNDAKLSPNDEMFTCVGSADDAFKVESVDRMTISQDGKNELKVIERGNTLIPSITRVDYAAKGIIVGNRIPINLFDFEEGKILTIEGAVTMKLADGSSRRLNVDLGSVLRYLQDESNEASYTVDVALQAAEESAIGLSNSAAGVAAAALKGFAIAALFLLL